MIAGDASLARVQDRNGRIFEVSVFEVSVFGNALGAGPELARQRSLNNPNAPRPHRLLKALHELIEVVWNIAKPGQDFGLTDRATLSVESERDHSRAALARSDLLSLLARLILAPCLGLGGRLSASRCGQRWPVVVCSSDVAVWCGCPALVMPQRLPERPVRPSSSRPAARQAG